MARELQEIKDLIDDEAAVRPELAETLSSQYSTDEWRLWRDIVAYVHWLLESLWDLAKENLETIVNNAVVFNLQWYGARVLEWQYGYALSVSEGKAFYDVLDESARLVEKVSVTEFHGRVVIKVAKLDSGVLAPLSPTEKLSLAAFVEDIKGPGTPTRVISEAPDAGVFNLAIYYDPQTGEPITSANVDQAIEAFLSGIPFNGKFYLTRFIDAMLEVEGVIDLEVGSIVFTAGATTTTLDRVYSFAGGYAIVDPSAPLSSTINYLTE